jgi:hypothetical protein
VTRKVTPREEAIGRWSASLVGMNAEADVLRRGLTAPARWLFDKITLRSTK